MPFCTNCGGQVADTDIFCGVCGTRQATGPQAPSTGDPGAKRNAFENVDDNTASVLCYLPLVGWIAAIVVLASERFRLNRQIRFHAFQGLYIFVAWLLIDWVVSPILTFSGQGHWGWGPQVALSALLKVAVWVAWIFMLVKTSQHQLYRLPILGELADRSVAEQR
jgi:uncharacterized membrane protein